MKSRLSVRERRNSGQNEANIIRVTLFPMIYPAFVFVNPGAAALAKPFALYGSQLIPNDFIGTTLGFMAGGAEVLGIGQGP